MSPPAQAADDGKIRVSLFGVCVCVGVGVGVGGRVTGLGNLADENRAVTGFPAIALRASMKLVLRQGMREGIELRADDNILPLIETTAVDRGGLSTLEITAGKGASFSSRNSIVAPLDLVTLCALTVSGSGEVVGDALKTSGLPVAVNGSGIVRLNQLVADEVSAKAAGSGDIEFGGRTGKLGISISGSGDVKTRALEADDVTVNVAGSGEADVSARKTPTVAIAGSGDVSYRGEAVVKSPIAGSGNVTKR